jgi:argininosuccinate lyase
VSRDGTGRITRPIAASARAIVFGTQVDEGLDLELPTICEVDRAHIVMLAEAGLLPRKSALALLDEIAGLTRSGFAALRGRHAPRGLYMLYESYLIERLGEAVGGALHTARSRNDLNATVLRLRLRAPVRALARELLRLDAVLLRRARRHARVLMPAYTHGQPAQPASYGYYLAGLATAFARDTDALLDAARDIDRCPLGAGAGTGTTFAIHPARTAELLGFASVAEHATDAVASRDVVLRLLAQAAIAGVSLSRGASDLWWWCSQEAALLELPDDLVGSSSMMPNKRNPFLLEHVQGRAMAPLGAFVAAASAMHAAPFANSVTVGTEGVAPVWSALARLRDAAVLLRLVVAGAQPRPERMRECTARGFTIATEVANRVAVHCGLPFRAAHRLVGELVTEATRTGGALPALTQQRCGLPAGALAGLDPAEVALASEHGGGPGEVAFAHSLDALQVRWSALGQRLQEIARRWRDGAECLDAAVAALRAGRRDTP